MELQKIIDDLKTESEKLIKKGVAYDTAAKLLNTIGKIGGFPSPINQSPKKKRRMSPAGIKAIRKAQKARWKKVRQAKVIQMKRRA